MSTLDIFRTLSGITQTSPLEISPERAQKIGETISSSFRPDTTNTTVNLLPVSTYVQQGKGNFPTLAHIAPKQPPFSSHWAIVVDELEIAPTATLFHLVLEDDKDGNRRVMFKYISVSIRDRHIANAKLTKVGVTSFTIKQLIQIGHEMIEAFGNYHIVFWNCQTFAECYLRVITGSNAAFTEWTSATVANLFLCAFVVPAPFTSTSMVKERERKKTLCKAGAQAAAKELPNKQDENKILTEGDLLHWSDEVIDWIRNESLGDSETFKQLSPLKDDVTKNESLRTIRQLFWRALGRH
jgi:hypothetical protein